MEKLLFNVKKKKNHTMCINSCFCRYWRYNEDMRTMDPGYPKSITVWKGIPDSPQGAFVDKTNGMLTGKRLVGNIQMYINTFT